MSSVSVDEEPSRALALAPQWYDDPCVKCRKIAITLATPESASHLAVGRQTSQGCPSYTRNRDVLQNVAQFLDEAALVGQ